MELSYQKLHLELTSIGVVRVTVDYNGSGDSMDYLEVKAFIPTAQWLAAPAENEKFIAWVDAEKKIEAMERSTARTKEAERARTAAGVTACPIVGECFMVDFTALGYEANDTYDFFAAVFERVGAAFDFNNDGSAGEFEWDLLTNKTSLTAGYYENSRNDSEFEDLFGAGA